MDFMSEHPSLQQLSLYQSRALAPDLFLSIHRHLDSCPECFAECNAETKLKDDYEILLAAVTPSSDEPAYHLTKAEIAGHVRKNLDDVASEIAESHLEVCAECSQAAAALRSTGTGYPIVTDTNFGKQNPGGLSAFLMAQARPLRFAALLLFIIGAVLLVLVWGRKRANQLPRHDETVNVNAGKRELVPVPSPTGESQTGPITTPTNDGTVPAHSPKPANGNASEQLLSTSNSGADHSTGEDIPSIIAPSSRRAIVAALQTEKLEKPPILAELGGTKSQLQSESGNGRPFQLLSPVGQVLEGRIPTFRWQALSGTESYQVTIADDKLDEVATSGKISGTEWTAPLSLRPGGTYSWQVTAFKDGERITSPVLPAPQAKFKILDRKQSEELTRLKHAMPNYHLGLGVLYTQAGLLEKAELEFQELSRDKSHSALAEKLLQSLRSMKQ
jgi:hypothetical protein